MLPNPIGHHPDRVIALFRDELGYRYLGDWTDHLPTGAIHAPFSP